MLNTHTHAKMDTHKHVLTHIHTNIDTRMRASFNYKSRCFRKLNVILYSNSHQKFISTIFKKTRHCNKISVEDITLNVIGEIH